MSAVPHAGPGQRAGASREGESGRLRRSGGVGHGRGALRARARLRGVGAYPIGSFVHVDEVRERSYFWMDKSGPGHKSRERRILLDVAQRSDLSARSRAEALPPDPFGIGADVDTALKATRRAGPSAAERRGRRRRAVAGPRARLLPSRPRHGRHAGSHASARRCLRARVPALADRLVQPGHDPGSNGWSRALSSSRSGSSRSSTRRPLRSVAHFAELLSPELPSPLPLRNGPRAHAARVAPPGARGDPRRAEFDGVPVEGTRCRFRANAPLTFVPWRVSDAKLAWSGTPWTSLDVGLVPIGTARARRSPRSLSGFISWGSSARRSFSYRGSTSKRPAWSWR